MATRHTSHSAEHNCRFKQFGNKIFKSLIHFIHCLINVHVWNNFILVLLVIFLFYQIIFILVRAPLVFPILFLISSLKSPRSQVRWLPRQSDFSTLLMSIYFCWSFTENSFRPNDIILIFLELIFIPILSPCLLTVRTFSLFRLCLWSIYVHVIWKCRLFIYILCTDYSCDVVVVVVNGS